MHRISDVEMIITDNVQNRLATKQRSVPKEYYPPEAQDLIRFKDEENRCCMLS